MDFRQATDRLFVCITHQQLADALGVSVPTIRQARLAPGAKARRSPPPDWVHTVAAVAEVRASQLLRLTDTLRKSRKKRRTRAK